VEEATEQTLPQHWTLLLPDWLSCVPRCHARGGVGQPAQRNTWSGTGQGHPGKRGVQHTWIHEALCCFFSHSSKVSGVPWERGLHGQQARLWKLVDHEGPQRKLLQGPSEPRPAPGRARRGGTARNTWATQRRERPPRPRWQRQDLLRLGLLGQGRALAWDREPVALAQGPNALWPVGETWRVPCPGMHIGNDSTVPYSAFATRVQIQGLSLMKQQCRSHVARAAVHCAALLSLGMAFRSTETFPGMAAGQVADGGLAARAGESRSIPCAVIDPWKGWMLVEGAGPVRPSCDHLTSTLWGSSPFP